MATAELKFEREGNVFWVMFDKDLPKGAEEKIEVFYEGVPVVSRNPPWVGGITWGRDDLGEHFIVTTCQGIGASIWWPNKDHGVRRTRSRNEDQRYRAGTINCRR